MHSSILVVLASALMLCGCAGTTASGIEAQNGAPVGYRYYDNQHPNAVNSPSAEAIANAQRGTYLWPPAADIVK